MYHMQRKVDADKGLRGGEGGQMIMSVGVSPVNPNLVLFGTDMGGLWRSTDGGQNWYSVTENINMRAVMGIEFHPTKENLVYCIQGTKGTGLASRLAKTSLDGFYRSTDGGRTWEQVLHKLFLTSAASQDLIKFDDAGNVYVLSREGIYKSTDDGENFTLVGNPDVTSADTGEDSEENPDADDTDSSSGGVYAMWISGDGQTIVTATGASGVRLSTDGGATWSTKNVSANTTGASSVTVDPKNSNHWYAVFSGESYKIYETKNAGESWSRIKHYSYASKNAPVVVKAYYPTGSNTLRLHVVHTNMAHHYRYSDNNGLTWKNPTNINSITDDTFTQSTGYYTEALEICESDPNIAFFSYGDILYKSVNGGQSFAWSNAGYSGNYANNFVFDSKGRLWIPFTDRAMAVTDAPYKKGEYPTATKVIDNATIGTVGIDHTNEDIMYVSKGGWSDQTLYKSTDGGKNWSAVKDSATGETITYTSACKVIHFHKDYETNGVIYAGRYKSTDRGSTWTKLSYNIWDISPLDSDMLYSVDGSGNTVRSTDGGETWSTVRARYSAPETVMADKFDKNKFWVGCYSGNILRCTVGGGYTVLRPSNGLVAFGDANNSVVSLAQDPNDANHLVAGTNGSDAKTKTTGLFETYDGGDTWHVVKGLPSTRLVMTLAFTPAGDEILIGTCSQGTMIYDFNTYKNYLDKTLTVDTSDEILLASDANKYRVRFGKHQMSFSDRETPYFADGEIHIPIAKVLKEGGYEVNLGEGSETMSAKGENITYFIEKDSNILYINGERTEMEGSVKLNDGVLFAPLSFFDYTAEYNAVYDEDLRRVNVEFVPALKVTYVKESGGESATEYVGNGQKITLGTEFKKEGYEVSCWTDSSGNSYQVGEEITITEDTVLTAQWVRSNNVHFYTEGEKAYSPAGAVVVTDSYNTQTQSYNYSVNYSTHYSTGTLYVCDNVKISSDTKRDRKYVAYKINLAEMGEFESVNLRLSMSKVSSGGYFYVYGSDGEWNEKFGSTGIGYGESGQFEVRDSLPAIGSKIAQATVKSATTQCMIDVTDYLSAEKAKGKAYTIIYAVYHMTNTSGRTNFDGCRLYNLGASESLRPALIATEPVETETIIPGKKLYASADIEGRDGTAVLALYNKLQDGTLVFRGVKVSEKTENITQKVCIDVTGEEGESLLAKFFVWNSDRTLIPLMEKQIIASE